MNESMTETPSPELATNRICTVSGLRLKYWLNWEQYWWTRAWLRPPVLSWPPAGSPQFRACAWSSGSPGSRIDELEHDWEPQSWASHQQDLHSLAPAMKVYIGSPESCNDELEHDWDPQSWAGHQQDLHSLTPVLEVLAHLRAVLMNESMTETPSPELATSRISTASRLRLKYWPTMRLAASRARPTPNPVRNVPN